MDYVSKIKESLNNGKRYIVIYEESLNNGNSKVLTDLLNNDEFLNNYDIRIISDNDNLYNTRYKIHNMIEDFMGSFIGGYGESIKKIALIENYELLDDNTKAGISNVIADTEKNALLIIHTNSLDIYSKYMIKAIKKNGTDFKCFIAK